MAIQTCPTALIQAPAEHVWRLLTTTRGLQSWSGAKAVKGPDRPLATGDEFALLVGPGGLMEVRFSVLGLEPLRRLTLEAHFPLGIVGHENILIASTSNAACWVNYG